MEWVGRRVRQGQTQNALGQVKFIFPTLILFFAWYAIKSLFDREQRAFSHGCIRLAVLET
jgi:murein L,D-transpeptidase YcbB/YkuD